MSDGKAANKLVPPPPPLRVIGDDAKAQDIRLAVVLELVRNFPGVPDQSGVERIKKTSAELTKHILGGND